MSTQIETARKPFLSPSQLDMYCKCPEQYRRRYIEHEKIPPGIAMVKGKSFHAGAEHNMRQKIESGVDLTAAEIVDVAVDSFEAEAAGGLMFSWEEIARGAGIVIGEAKDSLVSLAGMHATHQAPDYQPVLVEATIEIELPGPRNLLGVVDLADDKDRVTDFKTSGRSKNQADADTSLQLTIYAAAFHAVIGRPPSEVRLDTLVELKKETKRQVLATSREEADMVALANRINAVSKAIDAGIFTPAVPGSWWCSARWCGYHATCPFVNPNSRASQAD
jgi:hypothetical protein